jgi:hypothetical protein
VLINSYLLKSLTIYITLSKRIFFIHKHTLLYHHPSHLIIFLIVLSSCLDRPKSLFYIIRDVFMSIRSPCTLNVSKDPLIITIFNQIYYAIYIWFGLYVIVQSESQFASANSLIRPFIHHPFTT